MRRTKTQLMGELLEEFFQRPYIAAKVAEGKLPDTWRAVVGDRIANETTELRLENHILHIRLRSSILRQELFYQREALRDALNEKSGVRLVNAVIIR
jgi:predicted nucleic acid-binding Zn ribbon protein